LKVYRKVSIVILISVLLFTISTTVMNFEISSLQTGFNESSREFSEISEECTAVIVTGTAARDGKALLMKNRDLYDHRINKPCQFDATEETFAFVAVNSVGMGINEKGLAIANTYMPALAESPEAGMMNCPLNQYILEHCENVSEVITQLQDRNSPIGPTGRSETYAVATCIGVIDSLGVGAFIEISNSRISVEYVVNSYQSRANHPRTFPGLARGPSGRDQYAFDACEAILHENGNISAKDLAQKVSRYVRHKEVNSSDFSISGEICNDNTVSAMVSISGDMRYSGKLNIMWGAYGTVPMVGVFMPSMACSGDPPEILSNMHNYTLEKQEYARTREEYYSSDRVREIQQYTFAAEEFAFSDYTNLLSEMPDGLNETELLITLDEFIHQLTSIIADMYVNEISNLPAYAEPYTIRFEPHITQNTTASSASTTTDEIIITTTPPSTNAINLDPIMIIAIGGITGLSLPILGYYFRNHLVKKHKQLS
jgi:hypothetical protein